MRFIGDVHGKWGQYEVIIKDVPASRQVGDFGFGFGTLEHSEDSNGTPKTAIVIKPQYEMIPGDHKALRGNHDNPAVCRQQPYWIADGQIEVINGRKIMYIGGAVSIDRLRRIEGAEWWSDEELSMGNLNDIVDSFLSERPDIMVTHDCPEEFGGLMEQWSGRSKLHMESRTRQALQCMFDLHKPKLWIFGHWHKDIDYAHKGTRFICLNELSYIDIAL